MDVLKLHLREASLAHGQTREGLSDGGAEVEQLEVPKC